MKKYWNVALVKLRDVPPIENVGGNVKLMPSSPPVSHFIESARK